MSGQYRVGGAIFKSTKSAGPEFTGFVEIDGVKTNIALWPKRSAKGQDYWQVGENKMLEKDAAVAPRAPAQHSPMKPKPPPYRRDPDMDEDIPF
jgi:hypothetical protein